MRSGALTPRTILSKALLAERFVDRRPCAALLLHRTTTSRYVSSNDVLEANVSGLRADFNDLKTDFRELKTEVRQLNGDFRAAVLRIDIDIKAAVTKLEIEIRAMDAKAEKDLEKFAT